MNEGLKSDGTIETGRPDSFTLACAFHWARRQREIDTAEQAARAALTQSRRHGGCTGWGMAGLPRRMTCSWCGLALRDEETATSESGIVFHPGCLRELRRYERAASRTSGTGDKPSTGSTHGGF